jgi:TrmH family RNA methyltransferase
MPKMDKYAIVFGNEGNGISNNVLNQCDKLYKIEMNDNCESLNVGVSSGIILYKLFEE